MESYHTISSCCGRCQPSALTIASILNHHMNLVLKMIVKIILPETQIQIRIERLQWSESFLCIGTAWRQQKSSKYSSV